MQSWVSFSEKVKEADVRLACPAPSAQMYDSKLEWTHGGVFVHSAIFLAGISLHSSSPPSQAHYTSSYQNFCPRCVKGHLYVCGQVLLPCRRRGRVLVSVVVCWLIDVCVEAGLVLGRGWHSEKQNEAERREVWQCGLFVLPL